MTDVDLIAFAAVVVLGLTVFARAEIMSPRIRSSYATNVIERGFMDLAAFAAAGLAFRLWDGLHVPWEVAGFFAVLAATSTVKLIRMRVHDGRDVVRTRVVETRMEDIAEVRAAVEETVPPAIDAAIPQVLKDLGRAVDPYEPH